MLELELNKYRNWVHRYLDEYRDWIYESRKGTDEYWDILNLTYEELADQTVQLIVGLIEKTEEYEKISYGALTQAINVHEAGKVNHLLDNQSLLRNIRYRVIRAKRLILISPSIILKAGCSRHDQAS